MLAEFVNSVRPPGRILTKHRAHMTHEGFWIRIRNRPVIGSSDALQGHLFHDVYPCWFPSGIAWCYKNSSFYSQKKKTYHKKNVGNIFFCCQHFPYQIIFFFFLVFQHGHDCLFYKRGNQLIAVYSNSYPH